MEEGFLRCCVFFSLLEPRYWRRTDAGWLNRRFFSAPIFKFKRILVAEIIPRQQKDDDRRHQVTVLAPKSWG
eukprot:scaffold8290_cov174-Amphora_coffeaeformis.AAC.1